MSHPDPCYDPDNSYEDDDMGYNYDDHDDFYQECEDYNDYYIEENEVEDDNDYDDSMDGDHESGLASAGWGTDEDYGHFCDDEAYGFYGDDYDYIGEDY